MYWSVMVIRWYGERCPGVVSELEVRATTDTQLCTGYKLVKHTSILPSEAGSWWCWFCATCEHVNIAVIEGPSTT